MPMNDFSDVWLSAFLDQRDTEATQREAEFVAASLRPSSTVLDIPCGFGRHSAILAHNETTTLRGDRVNVHLAYRGGRAIDQFEWQVFTPQELQDMAAAVGWALFGQFTDFDRKRRAAGDTARIQYAFRKVNSLTKLKLSADCSD